MSPALVSGFLTTGFPGSPELKKKKVHYLFIYLFFYLFKYEKNLFKRLKFLSNDTERQGKSAVQKPSVICMGSGSGRCSGSSDGA